MSFVKQISFPSDASSLVGLLDHMIALGKKEVMQKLTRFWKLETVS